MGHPTTAFSNWKLRNPLSSSESVGLVARGDLLPRTVRSGPLTNIHDNFPHTPRVGNDYSRDSDGSAAELSVADRAVSADMEGTDRKRRASRSQICLVSKDSRRSGEVEISA